MQHSSLSLSRDQGESFDGLRASAGRIGNQVFFFFFDVAVSVVGVVVSSTVEDLRAVDVEYVMCLDDF